MLECLKRYFDSIDYVRIFSVVTILICSISIFTFVFIPLLKPITATAYIFYMLFGIYGLYKRKKAYESFDAFEKKGMQLFFVIWISSFIMVLTFIPAILPITYPILFLMFIYYFIRYLASQILNTWWKYSLFFLFLLPSASIPIALLFVAGFESMVPISDRLFITAIISVIVVIPILLCIVVETKLLSEMKISIYFLLAITTFLSAITFLVAPYIEQELYKLLSEDPGTSTVRTHDENVELKEFLKSGVGYFFEIALLPYVISVAWCFFVIELRERKSKT